MGKLVDVATLGLVHGDDLFGASEQQSTSESAPWQPAQKSLKNLLSEMDKSYQSAKDVGYISPTGGTGDIYKQYLQQLQTKSPQIQQGISDLLSKSQATQQGGIDVMQRAAGGEMGITPEQIMSGAQTFMNDPLMQQQIQAATRGDVRNLTEGILPSIERGAVGTGNLGSSRTGVAEAIAQRGTQERIADVSAQMRGNALQNALSRSQSGLQSNLATQMGGAQNLAQMGGQQFGQAGRLAQTQMSGLSPVLQKAQLQQQIQGGQQADKIGRRDFLANLIRSQYAPTISGIGGMGGKNISTTPGPSMFDKLLSAGQAAASVYGAM